MLKSFRVKNFKSIQDSGEIELRPITLFIGANSSGKSSLLQVLLMLKQTLESRDKESPLITNGDYVKLGSYRDFIYAHEIKRDLEIDAAFDFPEKGFIDPSKYGGLSVTTSFDEERQKMWLKNYKQKSSDGPLLIDFSINNFGELLNTKSEIHPEIDDMMIKQYLELERRENFLFTSLPIFANSTITENLDVSMDFFFQNIKYVFEQFLYLRPLRSAAQRDYKVTGETAGDVGLSGEKTVQVLFQDKSQTEQRRKGLLAKVERWLKTFGFGHEPEIEELGGDNYRLLIKDANTGIAVNVSDVGFGVSQVLPVIVQGFAADDAATLIIEQPEIHLHPKAQSELGDLMIDIAGIKATEKSAQPKTLLIETHSEHLIRRLQLRIAEKQISEQDVAIYFVQATAEGSRFGKVTLDKYGRFENWPEGFFSEDVDEMFKLQNAIFDRLKEDKDEQRPSAVKEEVN